MYEPLQIQAGLRIFRRGEKAFGPGIARLLEGVEELGSLRSSARRMGMSYNKAWHVVRECEGNLGFPLLIRNKDRIVPTENGKKILYYCYQIIKNEDYLQETVSSIHGVLEGDINLGAYNSMLSGFVAQAIRNFSNGCSFPFSIYTYH